MAQLAVNEGGVLVPSRVAASLRAIGDRKFFAGMALGLALLAGGYAISQEGGGGGGGGTDPQSEVITDQVSVIAERMRQDASQCATGTTEGTVGYAINTSVRVHLELASAMPNVERLFDISGDCFSALSSIIDLSFAIPSLATILAAAQDAVLQYARKKICSAVGQVTGMVTGPINQAIGTINGIAGFGNLNGLTAGLNGGGGMSTINPNLGAGYNQGQGGTYTTGMPFGNRPPAQMGTAPGGGGDAGSQRVQAAYEAYAALQVPLQQARDAWDRAEQALRGCTENCGALQAERDAAYARWNNINQQFTDAARNYEAVMAEVRRANAPPPMPGTGGTPTAAFGGTSPNPVDQAAYDRLKSAPTAPEQPRTWTERIGNLFR